MNADSCPFCSPDEKRVIFREELATALYDAYPVSRGHILVVPNEHQADFLLLPSETRNAMIDLLARCREHLDEEFSPDGYNVGINIGLPAGQSVMHAHIHLIPRFRGDVERPRGGVRGVIPHKQNYP